MLPTPQATLTATQTNVAHPDYRRPEAIHATPDLQLIQDLLGGTRAMVGSPQIVHYIPPWPEEDAATWGKRSRAATLYEGFGRTLSASVGMIMAAPPQVTYPMDEARFAAHWLDMDGAGTKGDVFVKRFVELALAQGHALVVVDFPSLPESPVTLADESALNLRPRWAMYPRSAILSWRTETVRNHVETTQVVLYEPAQVADGPFGIRAVERFRVLSVRAGVAGYELWEKPSEDGGTWSLIDQGQYRNRQGATRDTLPIAVAYAGRTDAPFTSTPPLLGVAYANLSHWRNKTELQWGSRIAAIEQLVIEGQLAPNAKGDPGKVLVGWERIIHLTQGGDAKWVGPSGAGLGELAKRCHEAEQEMAALGMSFLSRDTRAAETAEAKRLDATAENSTLATAAQGAEDAINLAWSHHAWYEGVEDANAPSVSLNRDYDRVALDAPTGVMLAKLIEGGLPIRLAARVLQRSGFVDLTDESDFEQFVMEWETGRIAAEDSQALQDGAPAFGEAA